MNWKILLTGFIFWSAWATAQIPPNEKKSANYIYYFDQGETLLKAHHYAGALIHYNEALLINPYHAESYFSRAITKERLEDKEGALIDYNIFIELKPEEYDAMFSRGLLLYSLKKWKQAKGDFIRLLTLSHGETSTIYFRQDPFTSSIDQVFTTQGTDRSNLFNYLGLTEMELRQFDLGMAHFDSAIYINPYDADYYVNKGKCYEGLEDLANAKKAYEQALEYNPDHGVAKHNLSVLNLKDGDAQSAERMLDEVIAKNPDLPFPYAERAYYKMNIDDLDQALKDYNKAISLAPSTAEYWLSRGSVKEKMKDWASAYDDYTRAVELDERLEKAWLSRANLLFKRGEFSEAIKDYDVAVIVNPAYGQAYYNRALAKNKLGNNAEACMDLKRAQGSELKIPQKVMNGICGVQ